MRPITTVFFLFTMVGQSSLISQKSLPSTLVTTATGEKVNLADLTKDGNPKIVSLWATWCGPCRMELNALKEVYPKWQENYGVEIVAITIDYPSMLGRAKKMFDKNGWNYTFLHDEEQELMSKLGIQGIPYSMLIDGTGEIKSVQMGYFPGYEKKLEQKIKAL